MEGPAGYSHSPVGCARSARGQPNTISVASSGQRAGSGLRAGVLPSAIDAAVSAGTEGPIEKMLCHEMAAVHKAGMGLLIRVEESSHLPPGEVARLTNAAARLFEVFQNGALALQKFEAWRHPACPRAVPATGQRRGRRAGCRRQPDQTGIAEEGEGTKVSDQDHTVRRGWLRNGNPPGDPRTAPRCGAKTRLGHPCRAPKVHGRKRCRMHGGNSTGPRTPEGLERSRKAGWKHGARSREVREMLAENRQRWRALKDMLRDSSSR